MGEDMIKKIGLKMLVIGIALLLLLVVTVNVALSDDDFNAPTIPTMVPINSGGGGSSGGSGYTGGSTPSISFPVVFKIINSNGIVIGTATAYNYNDIRAHAEWNATVGNVTEWAYVDATLSSIPNSDLRMDVSFETPDASRMPSFVSAEKLLAQINITRCSGWNVNDGTFKIAVKVPKSAVDGLNAGDSFYFVQINGGVYQLLKADIAGPDEKGMMLYTATTTHMPLTADGSTVFEFAALASTQSTPTPTPTPTTLPTSTPAPTASGSGISTFVLLLMVFIPAVIAGLIIVYYEMLRKGK